LHPIVNWSSFNEWQYPFFEPSINTSFFEDIYISPKSVENDTSFKRIDLKINETAICSADSSLELRLISLDTSKLNIMQDEFRRVYATIVEFKNDSNILTDTLYSVLNLQTNTFNPIWYSIDETNVRTALVECSFDNDEFKATYKFAREIFTMEIARKPFINFVWLGTVIVVIGFFFAMFSHLNERKNN